MSKNRGLVLTIFVLCAVSIINTQTNKQHPTHLNVPRKYGSSYSINSDIEDIIRAKVAVLMPVLDDDKMRNDSEETREIDETGENTDNYDIDSDKMRAVPSFRENNATRNSNSNPAIQKYQKLRKEIEKLLMIEPISDDTKTVVNDALDQITNELMSHECVWEKKVKEDLVRRGQMNVDHNQPSIAIPTTMTQTELVMKHIKEKWDKVTNQYSMKIGDDPKNYNESVRQAAFLFLTRLRQFVFDVHDDYRKLHGQYAMRCKFEDVNKIEASERPTVVTKEVPIAKPTARPLEELRVLREGNDVPYNTPEGEEACNATVCSAELAEFLTDFYRQLNETQSEVFRNYIEMYLKEIDTNKGDRESFTKLMKRLKKHVEKSVKKRFAKDTAQLGLIPNFASARIEVLKRFVDSVVDNVKELIKTSLSIKLKKLPPKLRLVVRRDIQTTAGIELGNLQNDIKSKMCTVFETCNGEGARRKNTQKHHNRVDPNSIHINLKLGFDQESLKRIADQVTKRNVRKENGDISDLEHYIYLMKNPNIGNLRKTKIDYNGDRSKMPPFDISKYSRIKVTRTTYRNIVEKGTTKIILKNY